MQKLIRSGLLGFGLCTLLACAGPQGTKPDTDEIIINAPEPPAWYGQLTERSGRLLGYGQGPSREVAKQSALADVSQRLEVEVDSRVSHSVTDNNGEVSSEGTRSIELSSRQTLKHTNIVKEMIADNGYAFIAMEADFRPPARILADQLVESLGYRPGHIDWSGSPWLAASEFATQVKRHAIEIGGPKTKVTIDLSRQNEHWVVTVDTATHILEPEELGQVIAWQNTDSEAFKLQLKTNAKSRGVNRLRAGDHFSLVLQSADSEGYYALFNLYPDGRLVALQDSRPLAQQQEFPSLEQQKRGAILEAQTLTPDEVSHDVMLAVHSPQPVDTTRFQQVDQTLVEANERNYQIHRLLEWLEQADINSVAVLQLEIQP